MLIGHWTLDKRHGKFRLVMGAHYDINLPEYGVEEVFPGNEFIVTYDMGNCLDEKLSSLFNLS